MNLINQLKSGDNKAYKKLYAYFPVVKKWLRNQGCSTPDARDIFQQALLVLCEKCQKPDFALTSSVETYLFAVSKYIYFNQARDAQRKSIQELNEQEVEAANDVQELAQKEEKLKHAFEALKSLSKRCMDILTAFYFRKMSMKEIAQKLGFKSEKVAKNQKYKCLNHAKKVALSLNHKSN